MNPPKIQNHCVFKTECWSQRHRHTLENWIFTLTAFFSGVKAKNKTIFHSMCPVLGGIRRDVSGDHISLVFFLSRRFHHLGRLERSSLAPAPLFSVGELDLWHVKGAKHTLTLHSFFTHLTQGSIWTKICYTPWCDQRSRREREGGKNVSLRSKLAKFSGHMALKLTNFCFMPTTQWFMCPRLASLSHGAQEQAAAPIELTNHCSWSSQSLEQGVLDSRNPPRFVWWLIFLLQASKVEENVFYTLNAQTFR